MTVLHLGVVDIPYSEKDGTTTGDVAGWLEDRYHPMEIFAETRQQDIADAVVDSLKDAIDSLMMGAPPASDPFAAACGEIESGFRGFITSGEIEGMGIPGLPTQAAQDRVSRRFKNKRATVKKTSTPGNRPSLVDTGLYVGSFKAWVE